MKSTNVAVMAVLGLAIIAGIYGTSQKLGSLSSLQGVKDSSVSVSGEAAATSTRPAIAEAAEVDARTVGVSQSGTVQGAARASAAAGNASALSATVRQPSPVRASAQAAAAVTSPNGWYYVFVAPDDYFKTPGGSVVFHGSHFYPGETVAITYGNRVIGSVTASAAGTFVSDAVTVPYGVSKATYIFKGDVSKLAFSVTLTVGPRNPWIDLNDYYVRGGSKIVISGHQFGSAETITLSLDNQNMGTVTTNAEGEFSAAITVPAGIVGQRTVTARGSMTGTVASQEFSQAN